MKNIFLITTVITLFTLNSYCQLDEKTWLVGGTGSFNSFKTIESTTVQYLTSTETIKIQRNSKVFEINPKLGFFIIDKLVLGLSLTFTNEKSNSITLEGNSSGGISNSKFFLIGPFARYYFLEKDKNFNILLEANYQIGNSNAFNLSESKNKINSINLFIGPEIFFNSSVGMEFLFGYKRYNLKNDNINYISSTENGFQIAIGFQIHLEKN